MFKSMTRTVITGMIGNTFEWYDFALFGYFAPIIGDLFFPGTDRVAKLLAVFATFAIGYIFRPLGGVFFGYIGDRYGRKQALVLTILLMAFPTTIIGLLPTYYQWGVSASVILVMMRILQGLSMGGNYGGSITFTTEQATHKYRGLFGSFASTSCLFGILLGSTTAAFFTHFLSEPDLMSWGWRIPFLLGVSICVIGFYMRSRLDESQAFLQEQSSGHLMENPTKEVFANQKKTLSQVVLVIMLHDLSFYILFVYMTTYLSEVLGIAKDIAFAVNSINLIIVMISTVLSAWISDIIGRRTVMMIAASFFVCATIPLIQIMIYTADITTLLWAQMALAVAAGSYFGPTAAFMVESYPTAIRYSAVSITTNISGPLFGGTAPMVVTHLIALTGIALVPAYYLTLAAVISLIVLSKIRLQGLYSSNAPQVVNA